MKNQANFDQKRKKEKTHVKYLWERNIHVQGNIFITIKTKNIALEIEVGRVTGSHFGVTCSELRNTISKEAASILLFNIWMINIYTFTREG